MRRLTSYNRSLAPTAHFMQAEDCMRMTENLGGLCINCARTALTPGVGAADAGSQAHAGLRDRLCLESRLCEQTRLGGGTRSALPGSSYTRVWIQMLLLMPQKFNIPTLKIRPSIADAMEHNQTRSHRLKLRLLVVLPALANSWLPCVLASGPHARHPHARHAASTPHAPSQQRILSARY